MNHSEIAALMKGAAPVIRDFIAATVEPLLRRIVELEGVVAAMKSADYLEGLRPLIVEAAAAEVAKLPPAPAGKDGLRGDPGRLPVVRAWADEIHREGDVVTFAGSTYQALKDTGRAPTHADWICIASAGRDGEDGRTPVVRGTYADGVDYSMLDIVALNGASFIAKIDDPGPCPGDGWQLMAMQGKQGKPGESRKGDPGQNIKGDPGAPVVAATVDDQGMLTLVNGDGSTVDVDLYPLLSKIG